MRKVLVIAYYWPPAGGPGVQRWLKFVKYLQDFGIQPIVYVPENPHYPIIDPKLEREIPTDVRILKQPISEPYSWASILFKNRTKKISSGIIQEKEQSLIEKAMLWIRGNLFIPDARKFWVKPSIQFLTSIIKEEQIETVITTGPPHSLHLIGLGLKKRLKIQWVADFRDPWTSIGYHKKLRLTVGSQKKHKHLEKEVLTKADKIITTSKTTANEFRAITDISIKVITNGYDGPINEPNLDSEFTISHLGSLLTGRNPRSLWYVLKEIVAENAEFANDLKIQLAGVVGGEVLESISENGLTRFTTQMGYLDHEKVQQVQRNSQVLLLLEIDSVETQGIIPGKLFEYMNSRRPILAMGPRNWEAGEMVNEMSLGNYVSSDNSATIKQVILDWYSAYKKDALKVDAVGVEKFHRKELTKELANFI